MAAVTPSTPLELVADLPVEQVWTGPTTWRYRVSL